MIRSKTITDFKYGTINTIESRSLPRGAASDSLNWQTVTDRLALRKGYRIYGNETTGNGKITGLYVARKSDGTRIKFRTRGQKLETYVVATDAWTEVTVSAAIDVLGAGGDGKDMSFAEWHPITGDFLYLNSPYGPFLKIDLSTPTVATDAYNVANNYKGYIKIKQNRCWLWGRTDDPSGVYISAIGDPEDFTYSATRVAGEGQIFRQDDGGPVQTIESYGDEEYCIHTDKTWVITITADDTNATNVLYREKVGIENFRASVSTGDGIYYIDSSDRADPQLRLLTLGYGNDRVLPTPISKSRDYKGSNVGIDLSPYLFDKACGAEWKDYIIFAFRTSNSTQNNRTLIYNKRTKAIDILDYWVTVFAVDGGDLLVGDPVSNNVYIIFEDYTDENANITNYWVGNKDDLDFAGEKKLKRLRIKGRIGVDQEITIWMALDDGDYVNCGTISGSSSAVTSGDAIIGRTTIGRNEIGGGGSGDEGSEFVSEINVSSLLDRFNEITPKVVADEFGVAEISEFTYTDFRLKSEKLISRFR